jgi:hypothetical protein
MSEMRSTGGHGSRSYSYTVTETYSLEEAIDKASRGDLNPSEVYRKTPQALQAEIDRLASRQFSQRFSSLALSQQREVMYALKEEITRAKEGVSIVEALKMVKRGELDDLKFFQSLPDELRRILDNVAAKHGSTDFCGGSPQIRKLVIGIVLEMTQKGAAEAAERQAEEEAKVRAQEEARREAEEVKRRAHQEAMRLAQLETQRRAEEEARRQAEEARRRGELQAIRKSVKQCVLCGAPLGFINRLLGRDKHPMCTVWQE